MSVCSPNFHRTGNQTRKQPCITNALQKCRTSD
uniref:Uncharacterized protein n=1 Tax=Anguilla anguilla TaxID=7936 RepID=A0A0E9RUL4_ANGAN